MLRRSQGYRVGHALFPSAGVDERDLRRLVRVHWGTVDGSIEVHELPDEPNHGYAGIVLAALRRPNSSDGARSGQVRMG
jgi:hypothetical protein